MNRYVDKFIHIFFFLDDEVICMVCINDIKRMEKQRDIEGLLKCSIITYDESFFNYETDYDRALKERAFQFIIDEIGHEAINSLISLFNDPDVDIHLRAVECLREIGKGMQEEFHSELCEKYKKNFGFIDFLQSSDSSCSIEITKIAGDIWTNLNYESNFEQLLQNFDRLIIAMRTSEFDADIILYDDALRYIQQLYVALKQNKRFNQGNEALNKLSIINNEEGEAAKEALRYFSLLPLFGLYSRTDCDQRDITPSKGLVNIHTKRKSFYERNRSLTNKQIQENDDYMDDIISGLYAARIEYLTKDK
jgi:hypothetical protein